MRSGSVRSGPSTGEGHAQALSQPVTDVGLAKSVSSYPAIGGQPSQKVSRFLPSHLMHLYMYMYIIFRWTGVCTMYHQFSSVWSFGTASPSPHPKSAAPTQYIYSEPNHRYHGSPFTHKPYPKKFSCTEH